MTTRTTRTTADGAGGRRAQQPGLAPAHVGDTLGAVLLGTAVVALAALILGITVIVGGLTLERSYAGGQAPPNIGDLARTQVLTGIGLLLVAAAQLALSVAIVLYDWPTARPLSAVLDATLAVISTYLGLAVLTEGPQPDMVAALALLAVGAFFAGATVVHVVQLRRGLADD